MPITATLFGALSLLLASSIPPSAQASVLVSPHLPDLVEKVLPGVVNISSTTIVNYSVFGMQDFMRFWGIPQEHKQTSLGTGFIFEKDGMILTNNHVVDQADEVLVTLVDKRQFRARIIGKDPKMDLALLQIRDERKAVPADLKPVPLGNSSGVRIAEPVFAVGNPFGLQHTVTMGIISAKNRTIGIGPFDNFLQTDASINPGNSGGPLFNLKGEVVGINTVIYSRTGQSGGLGFAIPANEAKAIVPDLMKYGRVPRPWLGVQAQRLSPALVRYFKLSTQEGVLIYNLVQDGPAERAGLEQGDVLISVSGGEDAGETVPIKETLDLERAIGRHRPRESVRLKIVRGKKKLDLTLKLEELPARIEKLPQGII